MESPRENDIRPMEYRSLGAAQAPLIDLEPPENLANRVRELERALEQAKRASEQQTERARQAAQEHCRLLAGREQAAWRHECGAQLVAAIDDFRAHRDDFLARVEHEVVRLALGIAERILHREAQLDPLLLSGAVRVALGQLAESTEVHLRVPAGQKEMWGEMVRLMPGLPLRPDVRGDEGLREGDAILEASLGSVDLGVQAQLDEIERSFFDSGEGPVRSETTDPAPAVGRRG